ncbi:hypothetical protein vseg_013512 [Gypsophila vaccaria]
MEEIRVLEESKGIGLPNFLPRSAFMTILQRQINGNSEIPVSVMADAWSYIEEVVVSVLLRHCENYPLLLSSTRRAANALIARMKDESIKHVGKIVGMEKIADYTYNPEYMLVWNQMMLRQTDFMSIVEQNADNVALGSGLNIEGLGKINVSHISMYKHVAQQAYDLKVRMAAYWKIVPRRLVDSMALHLLLLIQNLVYEHLEAEIVKETMGPSGDGIKKLLDDSPSTATKRETLNKSIKLLKESKDVQSKIMDKTAVYE